MIPAFVGYSLYLLNKATFGRIILAHTSATTPRVSLKLWNKLLRFLVYLPPNTRHNLKEVRSVLSYTVTHPYLSGISKGDRYSINPQWHPAPHTCLATLKLCCCCRLEAYRSIMHLSTSYWCRLRPWLGYSLLNEEVWC